MTTKHFATNNDYVALEIEQRAPQFVNKEGKNNNMLSEERNRSELRA